MKINHKRFVFYQNGFTLIELLVGMVIGLLVALVIVQVLQIFETQKRTTTGTADAQTNGSIALYNISRELKVAGYPLMPAGSSGVADSPLECTTLRRNGANGAALSVLSPVILTNGVAVAGVSPDSDTITIHYGNSQSGGIPSKLGALAANVATVDTNFNCAVNDVSLSYDGDDCSISTVNAVTNTVDPMSITLADAAFTGGVAFPVGASIACLGSWDTVTYAVNQATGNLDRTVTNAAGVSTVAPVVAGVVNLQAQYGISSSVSSNQIVQWVEPSGATWGAPTTANRNLIKAIRIAVVARNSKPETSVVSAACTQAVAPTPTTGICAWQNVPATAPITTASPAPAIDLSPGNANWARYHYRVYETIIPLRNIIWSKDTL